MVAAEGSLSSYSRDEFPHWITIFGTCNTRETVLKRDGINVWDVPPGNPDRDCLQSQLIIPRSPGHSR